MTKGKFDTSVCELRQDVKVNFMKTIVYLLTPLLLFSCYNLKNKKNMEYQNKFNEAKKVYSFENWREAFNDGLEHYTQENFG